MIFKLVGSFLLIIVLLLGSSIAFSSTSFSDASSQLTSLISFSGEQPDNLGIKNGKLTDCPPTPNCVSSQSKDVTHKVNPLEYQGSPQQALNQLKTILEKIDNAEIIENHDHYIYAQFTTQIMGFVDDVEFYLDPASHLIHVRSASRMGDSDLGVNRRRVEKIRTEFSASGETTST